MIDWTKPPDPLAPAREPTPKREKLQYWADPDDDPSDVDLSDPTYLPAHVRSLVFNPARPKPATWPEAKWQMELILENSGECARMRAIDPGWVSPARGSGVVQSHIAATAPIPDGYTAQEHVWALYVWLDWYFQDQITRVTHPERYRDDQPAADKDALLADQLGDEERDRFDIGTVWGTTDTTTRRNLNRLIERGLVESREVPSSRGGAPLKLYRRREAGS